MAEEIKNLIASADIVLFQSSGCPYCSQAIDVIITMMALKQAGHPPKVIEATSAQRDALRRLTSSSSVPNVWIKGKFVGGCNDGPEPWMGIRKIINNGKLAEYLQ